MGFAEVWEEQHFKAIAKDSEENNVMARNKALIGKIWSYLWGKNLVLNGQKVNVDFNLDTYKDLVEVQVRKPIYRGGSVIYVLAKSQCEVTEEAIAKTLLELGVREAPIPRN